MIRKAAFSIIFLCFITSLEGQATRPDTILVKSGKLILKGLLWRPTGKGLFPTIMFCHGSYETTDTVFSLLQQVSSLGSVFAENGFIFFNLFRSGVGLSSRQGNNSAALMARAFEKNGLEGRNNIQLHQLETDQLNNVMAGLSFLYNRKDVDVHRLVVMGHSFGGSLALLVAEREPRLKAAIVFSAAGYSWDRSSQLRQRLIRAVKNIKMPIMIVHAKNDYSLKPGLALDSVLNQLHKPHLLKIYPVFGKTSREGHNMIFLNIEAWKQDVFNFLRDLKKY